MSEPRSKISPPSRPKPRTEIKATDKPPSTAKKPLQLSIPASLHQELKIYAAERGVTIKDLLITSYKEYRQAHS